MSDANSAPVEDAGTEDLSDFQAVSAILYRPPPHRTELELSNGLTLTYNEPSDIWIVHADAGSVVDVLNPGQWRSARRLCAYVSDLADEIEGDSDGEGEPWRWSQ